jgi:DHA2 family multidrug resistance protein
MGPRGIGTMICMFMVGRMMGRIDIRILLLIGLALTAWSMYEMTGWTPAVSEKTIAVVGFVQGCGLGFLFVPLTTVTFATLSPQHRGEAAGMYNLARNTGSAVGISVVMYLLTRNTQINHATLADHVTAYNRAFDHPVVHSMLSPWTGAGRAALDQVVNMQASIIAYVDDFKLMMILALLAMPLVFLLKKATPSKNDDHAVAIE